MSIELVTVWAALIAFAVLAYVVLDGFDLGVGILFFSVHDDRQRDMMVNSVAPVWDGNETWLVMGGGGLMAAFPLAYAILLPAFYPLLIAMLLALIFRGVAFEFRGWSDVHRRWWDRGFAVGSTVAAFCQGVMLGAFITGIAVEGRAYAGGWFDWLTPFTVFTGVAVVAGYGLLGATWLVMRCEGELQARCRHHARPLFVAVLGMIAIVSLWTPFAHPGVADRWFSMPNLIYLSPVPLLVAATAVWFWFGLARGAERAPFFAALGLFVLSYVGLGISLFPYVVPYAVTVEQAAAPPESLRFLLYGAAVLLPLILGYTAYAYRVFRGKVRADEGYH
ncbi:MAG: cytochrome d ubiquinol oxidase subunit II [Rhodospirillaceae bacterium]